MDFPNIFPCLWNKIGKDVLNFDKRINENSKQLLIFVKH